MARKKSFVRVCSNNISYAVKGSYLLFFVWNILLILLGGFEEYNIYEFIFATVFVSVHYLTEEPLVRFLEKIFVFLNSIPHYIFSIPRHTNKYIIGINTERNNADFVNKHGINRDDRFFIYAPLNKTEVKKLARNFVTLVFVSVTGFLLFVIFDQARTFPAISKEYFYYRSIILILFSLAIVFYKYIIRAISLCILIFHGLVFFLISNIDGLLFFCGKILDLTLRLAVKVIQDIFVSTDKIFSRKNKDIFEDRKTKSKLVMDEEQDNSPCYYQETVDLLKEFHFSKIIAWIMSHTEEEVFVYLFDDITRIIKKHKIRNTDKREVGLELLALIIKSITLEFLLDLIGRYSDEFKSYISRIGK